MVKIAINKCHGGFGLSDEGYKHYAKLKGLTLYPGGDHILGPIYWTVPANKRPKELNGDAWHKASDEEKEAHNKAWSESQLCAHDIDRDDPVLIQTIEDLGDNASGRFSELEVIEIPDGVEWQIEEYDGLEWIAEKHRTWG